MYITKSIFNAAACIGSIVGAVNGAAIDVSLDEIAANQNQSLSKRKEMDTMEGVSCKGQSGVDGFFWCNQPPGMSSMTILTSYIETLNDTRWFGEDEVIACAPGPYCLWANNVGPWGINGGEIKYLFYILAHTCVQHNCGSIPLGVRRGDNQYIPGHGRLIVDFNSGAPKVDGKWLNGIAPPVIPANIFHPTGRPGIRPFPASVEHPGLPAEHTPPPGPLKKDLWAPGRVPAYTPWRPNPTRRLSRQKSPSTVTITQPYQNTIPWLLGDP